jgi:hypothetical protein
VALGQQAYIFKARADTAAWKVQVEQSMTTERSTFQRITDSLISIAQSADSAAVTAVQQRNSLTQQVAALTRRTTTTRPVAEDVAQPDSLRLDAYVDLVTQLDSIIDYQAQVIGTYVDELASERIVRATLEARLRVAAGRIVDLEQLIARAPAVQAKSGGGLKTFLSGAVSGALVVVTGGLILLAR